MFNKDVDKTLNFSPIFINFAFLSAELSGQTVNMSTFYMTLIWTTQNQSKVDRQLTAINILHKISGHET